VTDENSVTCWLDGLKAGDGEDFRRLWDRYFVKLVRLAGARLPVHSRRAFDEEDVALSALKSFCEGVGQGRFPQLSDRDDLWRILATITTRKVIGCIRHHSRRKRGGGNVLGESAITEEDAASAEGLVLSLSREPTPEAAVEFADACDRLLNRLDDETLKLVAVRKLQGQSSDEIARTLGTTRRTVDRKLQLIRALWQEEGVG
jgi:DNA-directed RNA polymerase specialized sigma24 family protein